MGNKINERLGLKTATKKRLATHGAAVASTVRCPSCGSWHCCGTQSSNGQRLGSHWCALCGTFFLVAA